MPVSLPFQTKTATQVVSDIGLLHLLFDFFEIILLIFQNSKKMSQARFCCEKLPLIAYGQAVIDNKMALAKGNTCDLDRSSLR